MKNFKWMVGLFALTSGAVLADGELSRDVLLQHVERCRRFEHAQDRRDALDALKTRSGLSQDEWATMLFDVATNRSDRFILNDVGRYASTNHLSRLRAVVTNANFSSSFRLAAFRAFARADGYGERTASLVCNQSLKNNLTVVTESRMRGICTYGSMGGRAYPEPLRVVTLPPFQCFGLSCESRFAPQPQSRRA